MDYIYTILSGWQYCLTFNIVGLGVFLRDTSTLGGTGDRTGNHAVTSQPALPPELLPPRTDWTQTFTNLELNACVHEENVRIASKVVELADIPSSHHTGSGSGVRLQLSHHGWRLRGQLVLCPWLSCVGPQGLSGKYAHRPCYLSGKKCRPFYLFSNGVHGFCCGMFWAINSAFINNVLKFVYVVISIN